YAEWLWLERTGGPSAAASARSVAASAGPLLDVPPGDPGPSELFVESVYLRGGMALQALREEIGDEAFFELLWEWPARHHDAHARRPAPPPTTSPPAPRSTPGRPSPPCTTAGSPPPPSPPSAPRARSGPDLSVHGPSEPGHKPGLAFWPGVLGPWPESPGPEA